MQQDNAKTSLGAGVIPLDPQRTRYTLTSGKVADLLPGKGKHLRLASQMLGDRSDQVSQNFALISVLVRLDGRDLTLEDVEELDMHDVGELMTIVRGTAMSDEEKRRRSKEGTAKKPDPKDTEGPASQSST